MSLKQCKVRLQVLHITKQTQNKDYDCKQSTFTNFFPLKTEIFHEVTSLLTSDHCTVNDVTSNSKHSTNGPITEMRDSEKKRVLLSKKSTRDQKCTIKLKQAS